MRWLGVWTTGRDNIETVLPSLRAFSVMDKEEVKLHISSSKLCDPLVRNCQMSEDHLQPREPDAAREEMQRAPHLSQAAGLVSQPLPPLRFHPP